jgi:hypothetical protein
MKHDFQMLTKVVGVQKLSRGFAEMHETDSHGFLMEANWNELL